VHLQDEARAETLALDPAGDLDHGELDEIGGVPCMGALMAARSAARAARTARGADVGEPQAATEHGLDVTLRARELAGALHVLATPDSARNTFR
jgi:hypothetical protein